MSGNQREYEYNVALAECLAVSGWEVEVDGYGGWGIVYAITEEQRSALDAASSACQAEIGDGIFEVTEENVNYTYDNTVRVVDCLEENGYQTGERPTRSNFVSKTMEDPTSSVWDPYELISPTDIGAAVRACPQ